MVCSGWVRSCRKFDKNWKYLTRGPSTDDFSQYFTRVRVRESLVIWHGWWKSATFQWIPHSVRVKSTAFQSKEKKIYQKTYSEYFFGDFFFLSIMWHWIRWINEYMSWFAFNALQLIYSWCLIVFTIFWRCHICGYDLNNFNWIFYVLGLFCPCELSHELFINRSVKITQPPMSVIVSIIIRAPHISMNYDFNRVFPWWTEHENMMKKKKTLSFTNDL